MNRTPLDEAALYRLLRHHFDWVIEQIAQQPTSLETRDTSRPWQDAVVVVSRSANRWIKADPGRLPDQEVLDMLEDSKKPAAKDSQLRVVFDRQKGLDQ